MLNFPCGGAEGKHITCPTVPLQITADHWNSSLWTGDASNKKGASKVDKQFKLIYFQLHLSLTFSHQYISFIYFFPHHTPLISSVTIKASGLRLEARCVKFLLGSHNIFQSSTYAMQEINENLFQRPHSHTSIIRQRSCVGSSVSFSQRLGCYFSIWYSTYEIKQEHRVYSPFIIT